MKQLITIAIVLCSIGAMAQTKPTPPPVPPPATYSIKGLTEQEYTTIFQVFASAKEAIDYVPALKAEQKVNTRITIQQLSEVLSKKSSKDVPDTTQKVTPVPKAAKTPAKKGRKQ